MNVKKMQFIAVTLVFPFKMQYEFTQWGLFIDTSKRDLKRFLLHNEGFCASIPFRHSVFLKETYDTLEMIPQKLKQEDGGLQMHGDLKNLYMLLLGKQAGYTKFECRDQKTYYSMESWKRSVLVFGENNFLQENFEKILFSPFHI